MNLHTFSAGPEMLSVALSAFCPTRSLMSCVGQRVNVFMYGAVTRKQSVRCQMSDVHMSQPSIWLQR
jgi:hypothetical protein